MGRLAAILSALALVCVGCTKHNPDYVSEQPRDATVADLSATDRGGGELAPLPDSSGQADHGTVIPPEFGRLCTPGGKDCGAKQICIAFTNAAKGICLERCTTDEDCHAPSSEFLSKCGRHNEGLHSILVCHILCRHNLTKYRCPNEKDYVCQQLTSRDWACWAK